MNIFMQCIKSLYSPQDIAKFRFQGIGKTILYIFFLVFLTSVVSYSYFAFQMNKVVQEGMEYIETEVPEFEVIDGELITDLTEPQIFYDEEAALQFIVDSNGEWTSRDVVAEEVDTIALLQNEIIITSAGEVQTIDYTMIGNLTKADVLSFFDSIESLKVIFIPIIYLFYYLVAAAGTFIKILIFSLIGLLFASILKRKLKYAQSFRITAYAITLPTFLFTLIGILPLTLPFGLLLNWIITMTMLYLAIRSMPKPKSVE
ncbi:hypothetical protein Q73_09470 [Bacillus coahuilensis m2-6]|uniref:DUF1189 domain-containing protein n=1 Tax=Bacillus coahuilensis p1.1.43 TaxID=1150625 RepID=A0A147K7H8_9BACI|nr:DUF1189 domain-containing protein [Bacillus coahuilensis]KUP05995.1 hypothetical protein Q75_10050 [Bacillus coahuilensis p1.1.43]KUP07210.1 hypothetical protein Q73_09470 [Bacillus coahuilensis m2-6]